MKKNTRKLQLDTEEIIRQRIFIVRGKKVMLDFDLAQIYGVSTGNLNLAVKRNGDRFPPDFIFQLYDQEYRDLLLQFATANLNRTRSRHLPYAFTEHGVAMLSAVLKSKQAVQMSISPTILDKSHISCIVLLNSSQ